MVRFIVNSMVKVMRDWLGWGWDCVPILSFPEVRRSRSSREVSKEAQNGSICLAILNPTWNYLEKSPNLLRLVVVRFG